MGQWPHVESSLIPDMYLIDESFVVKLKTDKGYYADWFKCQLFNENSVKFNCARANIFMNNN